VSRNPYNLAKRRKRERVEADSPGVAAAAFITGMLAEGRTHHRAGRLGEAERLYRKILGLDAEHAESLHLLGIVALQAGQSDAALELIRRALASDGGKAAFHTDLGLVLQMRGRLEEAVGCYGRAIELKPESAAAHSNRGVALDHLGRLAEAEASLERAIELRPETAEAHANLGNLRQKLGRLADAEACQRRALAIQPGYAEAWSNLGSVLDLLGRPAEAFQALDRAVELKPEFAVAQVGLATQRLLMGDFAGGWPEFEARHRLGAARRFRQPQWHGEPLDGARILLHAEQGLGDTIQFLRYVPMVQAAGSEVVLEVQPELRRLADELMGTPPAANGAISESAWHCPLMSLPLAFGTRLGAGLESIPARVPYLFVPQDAEDKTAALAWPAEGLRVGLAWAGNPAHPKDRFRSIPLRQLEPLLELRGVRFYSLQAGEAGGQAAGLGITDLRPWIGDMADTAALVAQLDLVIAADTSVAHLAGALGKPVWVLLPSAPDWRWLLEREDSPWYPTMRLFRQPALGDWASVVERVRAELESLLAQGA
jgi:tetratricopeptide (TPR) repeat protein